MSTQLTMIKRWPYYVPDRHTRRRSRTTAGVLARIYSPESAIVTDLSLPDPWSCQHVVTESPAPALAFRMLAELDVRDGMRVLEVGTGTGYMTALLAHRLGDHAVTSVEIDPQIHDQARRQLAELGLHPRLVVRDGEQPPTEPSMYDRIVVGYATGEIPAVWIERLQVGGVLVARLTGRLGGGRPVVLRRSAGEPPALHGRFTTWTGDLPAHRPSALAKASPYRPLIDGESRAGSTFVDPATLTQDTPAALLAQVYAGMGTTCAARADGNGKLATLLRADDGSWAQISRRAHRNGRRDYRYGGRTQLVRALENAFIEYQALGAPGWAEFGITVRDGRCELYLDRNESPRWLLTSDAGARW